jgi:glycosyltransferase involved in cell wall biosynthesis
MNKMDGKLPVKAGLPLVIHVLTSLDFGGVERHMEVIAGVLGHAHMRHMFVAIGRGGAGEVKLRTLGANALCLGKRTNIPSFSALRALFTLFLRERPVVVHAHGAEANFHGLLAAWLARVPVRIGEEIGIPSHSPKAKRIFRLVYGAAHRVIGVSRVVTEWLVENREVPVGKALRVDNPVRLPPVRLDGGPKSDFFRIIFVGRLEPVKNPSGLLAGFSRLLAQGISAELWFVGDGSERSALEQSVAELALGEKVRFFGFQKNPENFIHQCHIVAQPSLSEGFSLGLVEAMACGVPVVSTAVGSAPEIVQEGETGWLLSRPDPELIAAALKDAWQLGAETLQEMGLRARASVEGRFEPAHYLDRIEALYRELAAESGNKSENG